MIVGTLEVRLLLREARTLKDKRQVVKSIKDRLRNHFNVSVAEVDEQDNRQLAVLGIAMVSNETHHPAQPPRGGTGRPRHGNFLGRLLAKAP
jgi:uncharacterized protein